MGLLQYTSNEMFSSTELVRKSKNIFDKLNKNEIEKAIILRDGKPNIIILDFKEYERIINEYLQLKNESLTNTSIKTYKIESTELQEEKSIKTEELNEIGDVELQNAFEEIDKLEFSFDSKKTKEEKAEQLKEFWD